MPKEVLSVDDRVPIDQLGTQGLLFDDRRRIATTIAQARDFIRLAKLIGERPTLAESFLGATPLARLLSGLQIAPADAQTAGFLGEVAASSMTW